MEGETFSMTSVEEGQYRNFPPKSPEIVEICEEISKISVDISGGDHSRSHDDVYVCVGKNDLHVLKWAIEHAVVCAGKVRVFLVHVFRPITYIATPVGRLSRSQLSKEQVQVYLREESNKRKHLLEKYIRLCNDSKVVVDTMLVESNDATGKAILELIHIANITNLVMGTKQSPLSRLSRNGLGKGEYVHKYAPQYCEVTLVYEGKKTKNNASNRKSQAAARRHSERHFFECVCFSGKHT
ncbi:hypothetical protein ABFS82_09G015200 [Erythranthe guttata]|nr:PREDICTED: uncharacterized protein LOC105975090 [Erythranthe guttata]|eukprot:XP_012855717.1 PREDICTED: uncharacterized protein LOC105975090 [Erythranthe guttata]